MEKERAGASDEWWEMAKRLCTPHSFDEIQAAADELHRDIESR